MDVDLDPILDQVEVQRVVDDFRRDTEAFDNFLDIEKYFKQFNQATGILDAYNQYFTEGLQRQLEAVSIPYTYNGKSCSIFLKMTNPHRPTYVDVDGKTKRRTPARCYNLGMSYVTSIYVTYVIYEKNTSIIVKSFDDRPVQLVNIPVMVGSLLCYRSLAKNREQLIRLGENPDDPGGYFIRKGKINAIPNTEMMQIDKFFILHNKKRGYHARQTTNVPTGTSISEVIYRTVEPMKTGLKSCHYTTSKLGVAVGKVSRANANNSINILHLIDIIAFLFQRTDLVSEGKDGENHYGVRTILDLICTEDDDLRKVHQAKVLQALRGTIFEYNNVASGIALGRFLTWMGVDKDGKDNRLKRAEGCRAIQNDIFQVAPVYKKEGKYIVEQKIDMICMLACHFLMFESEIIPATNRDDWSNKKLNTATAVLGQKFWETYNHLMTSIATKVAAQTRGGDGPPTVIEPPHVRILTKAFMSPFTDQGKKTQGTTGSAFIPSQKLHPTNVFELISAITNIQVNINKTAKNPGLRNIHGSQLLYVCPGKTPDGQRLGIVQHQALLAQCTVNDGSDQIVKSLAGHYSAEKSEMNRNRLVINGKPYGWCDGPRVRELLYRMRRGDPGKFDLTVSERRGKCIIASKWYSFEVERTVRKIIDRIAEMKSELYPWELVVDENSWGFISEEAKRALVAWSAVGRIASRTTFAIDALGHLSVYDNQGRLKSPVYVVRDNGRQIDGSRFVLLIDDPRYKTEKRSFQELEERGFIDWIDAHEESDPNFYRLSSKRAFYAKILHDEAIIAKYEHLQADIHAAEATPTIREQLQQQIDAIRPEYLKIDRAPCRYVALNEIAMYSTAASLAPSSHHDPAGKTTHTAKTIPQTLGLQSNPYIHRKEYYLLASDIPLAAPVIGGIVGDQRSMLGVGASLAFVDMKENQEDALVMSSALLDIKMMMYATQNVITAELSVGGTNSQYLGIPPNLSEGAKERYRHLTEFGIPPIGYRLKKGDIAISYYSVQEGIAKRREEIVTKAEEGVVKDVMFYRAYGKDGEVSKDETVVVSLLIVNIKKPQRGDKFTLPHGQKSITALVADPVDMVIDAITGFRPDIILNTHAITGRWTIGVFLDMILGLSAAQTAKFFDTSAFIQHDFYTIIEKLKEMGYGFIHTNFIEPTTGRIYSGISYTGFTRLHQLHHFADQKIDAIGHAELNPVTKRRNKNASTAGQSTGGMEARMYMAYGMQENFNEKFMTLSDHYVAYTCKSCRQVSGVYSEHCFYCKEPSKDNVFRCQVPSTYKDVKDLLLMNSIRLYSNIGTEEEFASGYVEQLRGRAGVDGGLELEEPQTTEI